MQDGVFRCGDGMVARAYIAGVRGDGVEVWVAVGLRLWDCQGLSRLYLYLWTCSYADEFVIDGSQTSKES